MTDEKKLPQVRFQEFSDEWIQQKAGSIFETKDDRRHPELPVLAASQEFGMVQRSKINYDITYDAKNAVTYKRVMPGQFVIHLRSFQGGFAHSDAEGITSPAYTVMDFREKEGHDDYYWKYVFSSNRFIKRLETVTYGIRDGRSISYNDFKELNFAFPENNEQKKIGALLKQLNRLIAKEKSKYEKLLNLKKSMLEKMFPREDSCVPAVRFKGFKEIWEQRRLSDETILIETGKSKFSFKENGEYAILGSTSVIGYDNSYDYDGDFLLTARVGANAGNLYRYAGKVKISDNTVFIQGDNLNFTYYLLTNFGIRKLSFGTGQPLVKASELKGLNLYFPDDLNERFVIEAMFTQFDTLTTLYEKKLEKLQNLKKALLEKMFV